MIAFFKTAHIFVKCANPVSLAFFLTIASVFSKLNSIFKTSLLVFLLLVGFLRKQVTIMSSIIMTSIRFESKDHGFNFLS